MPDRVPVRHRARLTRLSRGLTAFGKTALVPLGRELGVRVTVSRADTVYALFRPPLTRRWAVRLHGRCFT